MVSFVDKIYVIKYNNFRRKLKPFLGEKNLLYKKFSVIKQKLSYAISYYLLAMKMLNFSMSPIRRKLIINS